ncbi:unnamed protein product [Allacma fusca]|uniref:Glucose-methanol-choline oxidoreductase N-terminal domain-containing protein n=1 Tax=Allacma fusca TaxID=39272 RepID=A0A8J2L6W1_9HEXA|nr:unnamed protein product [Allacma fusca]
MTLTMSPVLVWLSFSSINMWVVILSGFNFYHDYFSSKLYPVDSSEEFDFIVVGSGSAGSVVANRLSRNNRVFLLEAGGDPIHLHTIPGLAPDLLHRPQIDWIHKSLPQKDTLKAHVEQVSRWPRGKALGGSSNLNYMLYVRSHPLDYDNWANITGDPTWSYENVLPFFKKSNDYHGHFYNEKHYGQTGYGTLRVEELKWNPLKNCFINAGKQMGYPYIDLNGPQSSGFCELEVNQKNGERCGTFQAFVRPILHRENLVISRYSQATKAIPNKYSLQEGM